mmetsp:Transcript_13839/g.18903  ORF Transcript_13839/g.18903 Transcript_13839/m.18903 type:complete len:205 (-) Transcript_13839:655-1269(-)
MIKLSVTCKKPMITCSRSVAWTRTWPSYSKCSTCRTSTRTSLRASANSDTSPRARSSSSTVRAMQRCAKKSSHTCCRATSIEFSPTSTICSSSRSNSPSIMPSTPSSPTCSARLTGKNSARFPSARQPGASTCSKPTCASPSAPTTTSSFRRLMRAAATSQRSKLTLSACPSSRSLASKTTLGWSSTYSRQADSKKSTSMCLSA